MPHQNLSVLFQDRFRHASSFFKLSFLLSLYVFRPVRASCFLPLWGRKKLSVSGASSWIVPEDGLLQPRPCGAGLLLSGGKRTLPAR